MTIKNLRYSFILLALFAFAGTAAAQGPVVNVDNTSAELEMSATVETALQLNISTGTGGVTVTGSNSTGVFAIDFGLVNGLGLGGSTATVTVQTDSGGALYSTPINLTPVYSGFLVTETADVTVIADASSPNKLLAREGSSTITFGDTVSASHAAFSGAATDSANERHVGFYIPKATVAGDIVANLIYTVTMNVD